MNASGGVKILHDKEHIGKGITMNIRAIALLGALVGLSFHGLCIAQEVEVKSAELSVTQIFNDQVESEDLTDDRFLDVEGQFPEADFDLSDINPDDLFAEIQAFEKENPQIDIPLEAKIKLAWEYLKIKAYERKTCIIGTVLLSTAVLGVLCVLYKCYASKKQTSA